MKKSHLKNSFIAAGIAVFAGVITLGANVAFGGDTPKLDPSASGLVAPTFSGLDVRGDIKNDATGQNVKITDDDGLTITKALMVPLIKNATSVLNPVKIDDNLEITGSIKNPTDATSLLLDDDVYLSGLMDIWGVIKNTSTTGSGASAVENPVIINDKEGLLVTGDTEITKALTINGNLFTNGDYIYLGKDDGSSEIHGMGELIMAGNLSYAAGTISGLREIKNAQGQDLWINVGGALIAMKENGDIDLTGNIRGKGTDPLKFKDDIEASGSLKLQSNGNNNYQLATGTWGAIELGPESGQQLLIDRDSIDSYGGDLTINSWGSTNVNIGKSTDNSDLKVYGKVKASGGFGTYTRREAVSIPVGANSTAASSKACNDGEIVISCGIWSSQYKILTSHLYPGSDNKTCYAGVKSYFDGAGTFNVYAYCLNPGS